MSICPSHVSQHPDSEEDAVCFGSCHRPLTEASGPHAGLLSTSRAYRSLGFPDLITAALKLRKRQRGYSEGQMIESLVLLQTVGGDCPEDIRLLANDPCLERGLGYVALRLLKPQGVLFGDGSDRHHHAVITNRDLRGDRLLNWHREKAGTVEHVHDEIKNGLGGGHMPSRHFAVNAAWFKLALLSYNLASAIKGLCFDPQERTVRFKKYRLLLVHLAGRMNRNNCVMGLRLCAPPEAIARMQKVWDVFSLPTHATANKPMGRSSP